MKQQTGTATGKDTRKTMTEQSMRGYTQVRHILVQLPDQDKPRASTLAKMMSGRQHRALLLYILLLTCWPWLKDEWEPLEAKVWIRALEAKGAPTWSPSTLSRAWADLVELGLVTTKREGRLLRVTPRREDGGADYEAPGGRRDRWNAYFALPDIFWTDEIFAQLSLPGLVMFLVIAKETNKAREVWLPYDRAERWYGIKPKSAQNGLTELQKLGLVKRRPERIKAPLAPNGETLHLHYSLVGEFNSTSRKALQDRAKTAVRAQLMKKKSPPAPTQGTQVP